MREPSEAERRVKDLELALKHERDRSSALERRNEALEEMARRAYGMVAPLPRTRED